MDQRENGWTREITMDITSIQEIKQSKIYFSFESNATGSFLSPHPRFLSLSQQLAYSALITKYSSSYSQTLNFWQVFTLNIHPALAQHTV